MARYVALLRGVSPMNCRMPVLKACLEDAGFTDVKTLLTSGNVAFDARSSTPAALQKRIEHAMQAGPGYAFMTVVRPTAHLQRLLAAEPFAGARLPPGTKPIVVFLREPLADGAVALPEAGEGGGVVKLAGGEAFAYYLPGPKASGFMARLERAFGKALTTRTLDTVARCAAA